MRHLFTFVRRFSGMFHQDKRDRELEEEIESNLQMHIADNLRAGMSEQEARRQAILKLGGVEATKEAYRDQRGLPLLDALIQDVRYGVRGLRRSPGFALMATLTLAMGIGATAAIFSAVYTLLLHPLPYRDPSRLVWVSENGAIAAADMVAWRERGRPFEAVCGYGVNEYTLSGAGPAARTPGAIVSTNFLSLLGVVPQRGRDFLPADALSGSPAVALVSDALWRERFSADPRVVGTALDLDGQAYAVAGVLPPSFRFPDVASAPQVLIAFHDPASSAVDTAEPMVFFQVLARLRPGEPLGSVRTELQTIQDSRHRAYPAPLARMVEGRKVEVTPLQRHLAGDSRKPLILLLAAVGFVLLIACGNVANLQLVRAAARRHEVAVRAALGAARTRLAQQFLVESLVIGAIAASAGLLIASLAIDAIRTWQSPALPWLASVSLDPWVFGFTLGVALIAAISFGAAPAIRGSRVHPLDAMKSSPLGISAARDHRRLRNTLVTAEIALALVLLIGAMLTIRSFRGLMRTDPGYDPHNVLTAKVQLPIEPSADQSILSFASAALPRLQALAGVKYAALAGRLPFEPNHTATMAWFGAAMPPKQTWRNLRVPLVAVSPDFFRVLGTTIIQGRHFQSDDDARSAGVAIVNRSFARQFCPDGALGKRFHSMLPEHCAGCMPGQPAELEIVGVAADVHQQGLDRPVEPQIYVPFAQSPQPGFQAVLATNINPSALAAPLRSTVFALNHQAPVYEVATLEQRLSESLAQRRLTMFLLSAFAVLALMLAAIGVYGVISYTVVRRTQEIGIRVALGATREGVMRLILAELARTILLGSAAGLALAVALSGVLSSLLYGVKPLDFTAFALSWILLTAVAFLAGAAPAWRAMRADPCTALHCE